MKTVRILDNHYFLKYLSTTTSSCTSYGLLCLLIFFYASHVYSIAENLLVAISELGLLVPVVKLQILYEEVV